MLRKISLWPLFLMFAALVTAMSLVSCAWAGEEARAEANPLLTAGKAAAVVVGASAGYQTLREGSDFRRHVRRARDFYKNATWMADDAIASPSSVQAIKRANAKAAEGHMAEEVSLARRSLRKAGVGGIVTALSAGALALSSLGSAPRVNPAMAENQIKVLAAGEAFATPDSSARRSAGEGAALR